MVLKERDLILGEDEKEAWRVVEMGRARMKEVWKNCFRLMMEAESREFLDKSYFGTLEGLIGVASMKIS